MEKRWLQTAIDARRQLGTAPQTLGMPADYAQAFFRKAGKLSMARLHDLAVEKGISAATLRNYLVALQALYDVEDQWARKQLETWSAVAVAAFGRWYRRDRESALGFLYRNPTASLASFLAAESAARDRMGLKNVRPFLRLDNELIAKIKPGESILAALGSNERLLSEPNLALRYDIPSVFRFIGLDSVIAPANSVLDADASSAGIAGIIELAQFELLESYGKRSKEIWQRAASAAVFSPLVLVVFPGPGARRRFLDALPHASSKPFGAFAGVAQSPQAYTGNSHRPIFIRPTGGLGLVVFTSTITLLRDLAY